MTLNLVQVNCEPEPLGPENAHAIGFCTKEVELTHELAAIRNVNVETSRIWKIKNESVRNRLTGAALEHAYTSHVTDHAGTSCLFVYEANAATRLVSPAEWLHTDQRPLCRSMFMRHQS